DHQPVEAGRPSAWYRLRKLARRNRVALTTTALVAAALLAGTAVSLWQAIEARRSRAEAIERRTEAVQQRDPARKAVDEMYPEVAQKWLSQQPQLEPLQREFLLKALAFYQDFAQQRREDPEARHALARAYQRAGQIQWKSGRSREAEAAFRRALEL